MSLILFTAFWGLVTILFCYIIYLTFDIRHDVKEHIDIAQKKYAGEPEDALIAFVADSCNSTFDRSTTGIWTLGQVRSKKALPFMKELNKNDPEGKTCFSRHKLVLCQYEIHKAIVSIEYGWLGDKETNWFGSWPGLNK